MDKNSSRGDRYSVKLLFQYRVLVNGKPNIMRTCEERMVVLRAKSAGSALSAAKRRGKSGEFQRTNPAGNKVFFEFVGVLDLLLLGPECEDDEVWYDNRASDSQISGMFARGCRPRMNMIRTEFDPRV